MSTSILFPEYGTSHVSYALERIFGTSKARLLQQIHYWHENKKTAGYICPKGFKWIYNSAKKWASQINRSEGTIRRIVPELLDAGVIHVDKPKASTDRDQTNHYRINYKALKKLLLSKGDIPEEITPKQNVRVESNIVRGSTLSQVEDVIQRVPTEITYKEFAAAPVSKPVASPAPVEPVLEKKNIKSSFSGDGIKGSIKDRLASFMSSVSKTNKVEEYLGNPSPEKEISERTKSDIFAKTYGHYTGLAPSSLIKVLCRKNLAKSHNPHQDKKHMEQLANWYEEDPKSRLRPLVDAFTTIKTRHQNVWSSSYVLRGLQSDPIS